MMKRLSLSLLAVGMITLIVSAATYALFTADGGNASNTFTSGTVSFGQPYTTLADITNIAPGDAGASQYKVQYTGSLEAYIGVKANATGDLMTCDGANSLAVTLNDATMSYPIDNAIHVVGGAKQAGGYIADFNVAWNLPLAAGNTCQAKAAQFTIAVMAVQAKNNDAGSAPNSWN